MKVCGAKPLSIRASKVFYVVLPFEYDALAKKLRALKDCRLYEVSPSSFPGKKSIQCLGMLVAGKDETEACKICDELIRMAMA